MALIFNDRQTQVPQEILDQLPHDTIERFMELIESVPFVKWMVSPDRPRAKDLPRDEKGRIIVDVTRPHILEDMDYFREMAIAYENSSDDDDKKTYTKLRPNGNPNSEYMKLWKREIDRIWNGMVRESDGEWIPGILYFYWNYTRIMFTETVDGTEKGNRIEGFPEAWDSTYIWAHYIYQAQYGGKYNNFVGGEHFGVIARRGVGKSFFLGSITTRVFMCGENEKVNKKAKVFFFAYDKQYIDTGKDGTLGKFVDMFEFLAKKTQFPHLLWQDQPASMHWTLGYETKDGRRHGLLNEVTGVTVKDKPSKVRGKRGVYTFFEEFGANPSFIETFTTARRNNEEGKISFGTMGCIGCVCAGTKVLDRNFNEVNIEDLKQDDGIIGFDLDNDCYSIEPITYMQDECYKECVEIQTKNRILRCSLDHPILTKRKGICNLPYYVWTEAGEFLNDKNIAVAVPETQQKTFEKKINFEKVISVKPIGVQRIYNLTADKTHTYIANGIITHNTGGTKNNDFSGALKMIYHPKGYRMHALPNVFDKSKGNLGESILFLGAYMNRKTCYDKDGNSDVIKAILEVLADWHTIRVSSSDPGTLAQAKAEDPLTIEDAIMKTEKNIYPVADLNARIQELRMHPRALDDVYVGKLKIVGGGVEFEKTTDIPIRDFPLGDNKADGALEIFAMPQVDKATGRPVSGRYLLGADVYDNDVSDTLSLGSVIVLDAFTDSIVAEFTGRPMAEDFYEVCRRLCLFYNGMLCYENNYKGLYAYFSRYHSTYLLTPTFQYLRDEDRLDGESVGNTAYGVRATTPIRNYSRGLIREWLLKPKTKTVLVDGVEVEETYPQLMDIKNVALLKELASYDTDHNFDRHDALAMVMLYRQDVYRLNEGNPERNARQAEDRFKDDKFFNEYERKLEAKKRINKMKRYQY